MKTQAVVKIVNFQNGELTLKIVGDIDRVKIAEYVQHRNRNAEKLTALPIELFLSDKYQKRATGKNSQNAKLHGIIRQLAISTGNDFNVVKAVIKQRALNAGYPVAKTAAGDVKINPLTKNFVPQSEALCTTVEESILIDTAYLIAAELGIYIEE